jgi:serine/threonine protein kinase
MLATLRHRVGEPIQDRYEIEAELGSGAFGTVYKCRDRELDTLVAIKEMHVLDDASTPANEREQALAQFRREATHLSNLRHPNIVSGYYQPHNGTWLVCPVCGFAFKGAPTCPAHNARPVVLKQRNYLVMEYLDGPNLAQAAQNAGGVLPLPVALRLIHQSADALKQVHARNWVHRDIKPENIRLRTQNDDAVLLDFGIATESGATGDFTTRAQRHTQGGGTLGYAPDSPSERRNPDARSDIHALGMTLYHVLSGRDPQEADELAEMRRLPPSHFNRAVSPALEHLIQTSIAFDPDKRPQNAAEFLRALEEIEHPKTITPPRVVSAPPTPISQPPIPSLKFYANEEPRTVEQLISLCDRRPAEAREYLYSGHLETWLQHRGHSDLASRAREIAQRYSRRERGLEAWLQATGQVVPPQLVINPTFLDFGILAPGEARTLQIHLRNPGRGYLFGLVKSSHRCMQTASEFDGNSTVLEFTLDSARMDSGEYSGEVVLDSSAGEMHVPFRVIVRDKERQNVMIGVVFWAVMGMLGGFGMRTFPFLWQSATPGWNWLDATQQIPWKWIGPLFGMSLFLALCPFVAGESLRRRSCSTWFSLSMSAFLIAAVFGLIGDSVLRMIDLSLRPLLFDLAGSWAAGGWLFVGAILGASYGTLRQWELIFTTRLLQILSAWLIAMAIVYGLLAASRFIAPH